MTPDEIDTFGRIVSEFGDRVELFGRLLEKSIQLEGMKANNAQGSQLYPEEAFNGLAEEVDKIIKSNYTEIEPDGTIVSKKAEQ